MQVPCVPKSPLRFMDAQTCLTYQLEERFWRDCKGKIQTGYMFRCHLLHMQYGLDAKTLRKAKAESIYLIRHRLRVWTRAVGRLEKL